MVSSICPVPYCPYEIVNQMDMAMPTQKQKLGEFGEDHVVRNFACPSCKRSQTLRKLPANFKCADVICDFCGFLAQVKTANRPNVDVVPNQIPGAAWHPQFERMTAGIYFPLFLVLVDIVTSTTRTYYLAPDLQVPEMFVPRRPLSASAMRAGRQSFYYDLSLVRERFVALDAARGDQAWGGKTKHNRNMQHHWTGSSRR